MLVFIALIMECGQPQQNGKTGKNTAPVVTSASLLPRNPTVTSTIKAEIVSSDKDNDPITYTVKWFLNDREIGQGMSFSHDEVEKGDKIFAEVTPHDGKTSGKPVKTNSVTIGGSPPKILSLQIAPESLFVTTPQVVVTATAEDPDHDEVRLIVHWVVNDDVVQDSANSLALRQYSLKKNDVIHGSAFVDDGDFRSEPFLFELHIANAPPVFTTPTDSVKCSPDEVYYKLPIMDPDGDAITYELLEAPEGLTIDRSSGVITGSVGDATSFEIAVRATDSEGAFMEARFTLATPTE